MQNFHLLICAGVLILCFALHGLTYRWAFQMIGKESVSLRQSWATLGGIWSLQGVWLLGLWVTQGFLTYDIIFKPLILIVFTPITGSLVIYARHYVRFVDSFLIWLLSSLIIAGIGVGAFYLLNSFGLYS